MIPSLCARVPEHLFGSKDSGRRFSLGGGRGLDVTILSLPVAVGPFVTLVARQLIVVRAQGWISHLPQSLTPEESEVYVCGRYLAI